MNERLKAIRKELNLSQDSFAKQLGITGPGISKIESGSRNLTEQMIKSICREFNVNEKWLRTGEGDMFDNLSKAELVANIVGNALKTDDEFVQNIFIALGKMSPEQWDKVKKFVKDLK
ncbi:helix-turn-helix domain protein [Clostridium sp. DL-VIII]|uniref:helix-turn-helix domain-containing protein n=1 Tax=Clostridium sp. DL-VIII TaxID=641107 RepID=UPI00023AF7AC|nr:helix-turn-helix transcriptional regulator [Clostridium sp. DL-VIII]EHI98008.1 helix-turn-helix domain protein [Clostridium sp. DL-VIII]